MALSSRLLHSRVALRIFFLFVACALLPVLALAALNYFQVRNRWEMQTSEQLRGTGKTIGLALFAQLTLAEQAMVIQRSQPLSSTPAGPGFAGLKLYLRQLRLLKPTNAGQTVFGPAGPSPLLSPAQWKYLDSGRSLLLIGPGQKGQPGIYLALERVPSHPEQGALIGKVKADFLWEPVERGCPTAAAAMVIGPDGQRLFSTATPDAGLPGNLNLHHPKTSGDLVWKGTKKALLAGYWSVFLRPRFATGDWTVLVAEPLRRAYAPVARFSLSFFLVLLLTVWIVLLLSSIYIRRSLVPLGRLKEGAQRIAEGDFTGRVDIHSRDEFADLALGFNAMADHLGQQFQTQRAMGEAVRAVLSAIDREKIVEALLRHLGWMVGAQHLQMTLLDHRLLDAGQTYLLIETGASSTLQSEPALLTPGEYEQLTAADELLTVSPTISFPGLLAPAQKQNTLNTFLLFPLRLQDRLTAVLALGYAGPGTTLQKDSLCTRQLAGQATVALTNARLVEELEQLNLGTLTALARAVDAKSHWTAGHSERVTRLATQIGETMGLGVRQLDILRRGGLLHDIGKIGVPGKLLDKTTRLSKEEYDIVRTHPTLGTRILEPISAYEDVLALIAQHHEWYDGSGYPAGLAGTKIVLEARVLAVADVFDALISDRPYRPGWELQRVISYIEEGAGRQFDPQVVQAFLQTVSTAPT